MNKPIPSIQIGGSNSGQIAQGDGNRQSQTSGLPTTGLTEADQATLHSLMAALKTQVAAEAPEDKKDAALGKVQELEDAVLAEKPKLGTMEYVKEWFEEHLPTLAGAVSHVLVTPMVSKVMEGAGTALFEDFRRRFGLP